MCLAWRTIGRSETCHRFLRGILGIIRGPALPLRAPASARKGALICQHTDWIVMTAPPAGWYLSGVASGRWPGINARAGEHRNERSWVCDPGMAFIDAVQWCTSICTSKICRRAFTPAYSPPLRLACPTAGKQTTLFLSDGA